MPPEIEFRDTNASGTLYSESAGIDFGTVQAQSVSAVETVYVRNVGDTPLQDCVVDCVAFSIANGFGSDAQVGTADETYDATTFSTVTSPWDDYESIAVGSGASHSPEVGGTLASTGGNDTFYTRWEPPSGSSVGAKVWGMQITGNYT